MEAKGSIDIRSQDIRSQGNSFETHPSPDVGHVTPVDLLLKIWGALVVLTVVTVAVTWVDLGSMNLIVAMGIATVKAALVCLYFMHLRWDRPVNGVIFLTAILFVAIFIAGVLLDTSVYQPDRIPDYAPEMNR
jgi:cytochrome c oxidase subunit 4